MNIRQICHNFSTRKATRSIKPLNYLYYSLESNRTFGHKIGSIVELPQDVDIIQCFDKLVKTSCGYENINGKPDNPHLNFFFNSKLQDFPLLQRV